MVDLLPDQTRRWQAVETVAREHFRRAGIEEIRTPLLEVTELFARGIGEGTDVVGKEMYSFLDRGDRSCTLRQKAPHCCPCGGAARVAEPGSSEALVWRRDVPHERPQAGRQRQFHQIGVEARVSSARSDVEVIAWPGICWQPGGPGLELEINSLGTPDDRQRYRAQLVAWLQERVDQLDSDSQQRLTTNPLRILDSKNTTTQALLADAPTLLMTLSEESAARFEEVQALLRRWQFLSR